MTQDVVIVFAAADNATAVMLEAALRREGVSCWLAGNIESEAEPALVTALDQCRLVVVIISSNGVSSTHVQVCLTKALELNIPVVPFRIESVDLSGARYPFNVFFRSVDALTRPLEPHVRALVGVVLDLLTQVAAEFPSEQRQRTHTDTPRTKDLAAFGRFLLEEYTWTFEPGQAERLSTLVNLADRTKGGDASLGDALKREIDQLPDVLRALVFIRQVIHRDLAPVDRREADQLLRRLIDIERGLKARNANAIEGLQRLLDTVRERYEVIGAPRGSPARVPSETVDGVHFSVTAPATVSRGTARLLDVWAHLASHRDSVIARAREQSALEDIRIKSEGPFGVSRGAFITARVKVKGLEVSPGEKTILWQGDVGNASFLITVPGDASEGQCNGEVAILVDGIPLANVLFVLVVAVTLRDDLRLFGNERRYRTAFASYASEDRDAVLGRIQGIAKVAPSLDVFLDVAKLRSGENWRERLRAEILARDVLYLFWSRAASLSKWVDWEWRCGYDARGARFIDPVPLVSPEIVPPRRSWQISISTIGYLHT